MIGRRLGLVAAAFALASLPAVGAQAGHTNYDPNDWFKYWDGSVAEGVNLKWR
jgi:hypothetical protein